MRNRLAMLAALITALALCGCGGDDEDRVYVIPLENGEIYALTIEDGTLVNLTEDPAEDYAPSWTPDGETVIFTTNRDGNWELYTMKPDGTEATNLTSSTTNEWEGVWSPDGEQIAFVSDRDGNPELYIMNADGTEVQRLTDDVAKDWEPAWSPDGDTLAFSSNRNDSFDIYTLPVPEPAEEPASTTQDGTEDPVEYPDVTRLTSNTYDNTHPSYSPTGDRILYLTNRDGGSVYYMNTNGSSQRSFFKSGWTQSPVCWSAETDQIAYARETGVNWPALYTLSPSGDKPVTAAQPTENQGDAYPAWSPDEATLLFTRWTRTEKPL